MSNLESNSPDMIGSSFMDYNKPDLKQRFIDEATFHIGEVLYKFPLTRIVGLNLIEISRPRRRAKAIRSLVDAYTKPKPHTLGHGEHVL